MKASNGAAYATGRPIRKSKGFLAAMREDITKRWQLYLMLLLPVSYILLFHYAPMYGITLAFKDFSLRDTLFGGTWAGMKYFNQFFDSPMLSLLLKNTLTITLYGLLVGFPIPILFALALNEIGNRHVVKTLQTITYAPYFISTVVMVGIILQVFHLRVGMVNNFLELLGLERIDFMGKVGYFRHIYVWSGVWQNTGFSAVIYIAALAGVDPSLVEASILDGATRLQKIRHINIPSIMPTIVIQFIFAIGGVMSLGFDKIWLMQNSINLPVSEVISTFVYKRGLEQMQYSYATAVGLFNAVINLTMLAIANFGARKLGDTSLW